MSRSRFAARRGGFTLIELLIVIVVIAILALIVIPRVMSASRKARESTLRGNLHQLRTAIAAFTADTGMYPAALTDLSLTIASAPTTGIDDNNASQNIPTGSYKGPYLNAQGGIGTTGVPINPFKNSTDADFTDISKHWTYGASPGEVEPAIPTSGSTLDGIPFSTL